MQLKLRSILPVVLAAVFATGSATASTYTEQVAGW